MAGALDLMPPHTYTSPHRQTGGQGTWGVGAGIDKEQSMIRNHKILLAAAMALMAFGALGASGAQAAEFHCSVEPCAVKVLPDGKPGPTGKTAHQVINIKVGESSFATTCNSVVGEGTLSATTSSTLRIANIEGSGCQIAGEAATLTMNGCEYLMNASGGMGGGGTLTIVCPPGKEIEAGTNATNCIYTIPPQGPLNEFTFHDAETGGVKKSELTVETHVTGILITTNGFCGTPEGYGTAELTTGNTILTSETDDKVGTMANIWWE